MERVGLGVSGVAIVVALVTLIVGVPQVPMVAVFVGLAALWPVVRARK